MWSAEKCAEQQSIGIQARKCLYEGVIVPTALYGIVAWPMGYEKC